MSRSREDILRRVAEALTDNRRPGGAGSPACGPVPPEPLSDRETLAEEFARRWQATGGRFHRAQSPADLPDLIRSILKDTDGREIAVASSALDLASNLTDILEDAGFAPRESDPATAAEAAAGLTGVRLALAYSGSLAVAGDPPGELSASLLPPLHLALIPASRVAAGPTRALEILADEDRPRALVFITGPSRTADIELTLVMGVHGPGRVHAVLLEYL